MQITTQLSTIGEKVLDIKRVHHRESTQWRVEVENDR